MEQMMLAWGVPRSRLIFRFGRNMSRRWFVGCDQLLWVPKFLPVGGLGAQESLSLRAVPRLLPEEAPGDDGSGEPWS